jgi:peptidoglycan/LPS O-acetylase OafA/YrhL
MINCPQSNSDNQPVISNSLISTNHLPALDSMRGLAALYVTIHHAIQLAGAALNPLPLLLKPVITFFSYGHYSVDVFIVLSGFCLMLPVVRNGGVMRGKVAQFYLKRARRILPPYYIAILFSVLSILFLIGQPTGGAWDMSLSIQFHDIITHFFLVHDLFRETRVTINPAFWSIAVEWRIYFLFPLIVFFWRKIGAIKTVVISSGLACLFSLIFSRIPSLNLDPIGPSPHFIVLFVLGMLVADFLFINSDLNIILREEIPWNELALFALLLALPAYQFFSVTGQSWIFADILVGIFSCSLLMIVFLGRLKPLNYFLNSSFLVKLGGFSYSLYLLHMPCLQIFIHYVIRPLGVNPVINLSILMVAAIPASLIVSYVFFLCCERPFLSQNAKRNLAV